MESEFVPAGTLNAPGPIGRVIRILIGLLVVHALYGFVNGVLNGGHRYFPRNILFWLAVVASYYSLPPVFNIGYGLPIGDWARRVYAIVPVRRCA